VLDLIEKSVRLLLWNPYPYVDTIQEAVSEGGYTQLLLTVTRAIRDAVHTSRFFD